MVELIKIYDGVFPTNTEIVCQPVVNPRYFLLNLPTVVSNETIGFNCNININITTSNIGYRKIPWKRIYDDDIFNNTIDNTHLLAIDTEYIHGDFEFALIIFSDINILSEVWCMQGQDSCTLKLNDVEEKIDSLITKQNLLLAGELLKTVANIAIPLLAGANPALLIPAAVANTIRGVLKFTLPVNAPSPVLIGYDDPPTTTNFNEIIYPGQSLRVDKWQGKIYGKSLNGSNVQMSAFKME